MSVALHRVALLQGTTDVVLREDDTPLVAELDPLQLRWHLPLRGLQQAVVVADTRYPASDRLQVGPSVGIGQQRIGDRYRFEFPAGEDGGDLSAKRLGKRRAGTDRQLRYIYRRGGGRRLPPRLNSGAEDQEER